MAKTKLERLFDLSDEESYAEYQQLTPSEKREFDILAKKRAEYFKQLSKESHEKIPSSGQGDHKVPSFTRPCVKTSCTSWPKWPD